MAERIAFFVQDLRGGGAERSVVRLANGVAARGYPTDLVLNRAEGPFLSEVEPAVRICPLGVRRSAFSIPALRRYIDREHPAALLSAMTHTNIVAIAATRLARFRTRLFVVEHNQFSANRAMKRGLARLAYSLVPYAYRFADVIAGVSEGVRDSIVEAARLPADRVIVLHNPIVSPALGALAEEPATHPWFPEGRPVLLAVGRLQPQKNYPLLIEAMKRVARESDARLIILGEGPDRDALQARIDGAGLHERIDLAGFAPNPFAYMARAAVYVMSSDWEGLPTVLIEALAVGAPVVSTNCRSGPSEILGNGAFGRLTPPGDADALAQALLDTLREPGPRGERINRAADFSVDRAIDRYLAAAGLPPNAA